MLAAKFAFRVLEAAPPAERREGDVVVDGLMKTIEFAHPTRTFVGKQGEDGRPVERADDDRQPGSRQHGAVIAWKSTL
jgi:hypothetical protein